MLMEITKNYNEKSDSKAATKTLQGDFLAGPGAETPSLSIQGTRVPFLIGELDLTRCH